MGDPRNENIVTQRCQSLVCDVATHAMSKACERFSFRFTFQKDKRPPKTSHAASNTVTQFHLSFILKVTSNLCQLTLSVRVSVEVNLSRNVRKQGINHVKDNIVLSKENHYFRTFEVTCTGPYSGRKEHLSGGVITKLIPSWHHEGLASWWYFPKVCFCGEHRQTAAMNWPSS